MHHVTLERWSRASSVLHRRDPRAKIVVLLGFLVAIATTPPHQLIYLLPGYVLLLLAALFCAKLPVGEVLARASVVLPFCAAFAVVSAATGDPGRAVALVAKSFLSAFAVLVIVGSTPLSQFVHGLEGLGVPRFLLWVIQFLHRYLFVVSEQAQHMRLAAVSRAATGRSRFRFWRLRAASGALAVLFARSYGRAEAAYRAMCSRGFDGRFRLLTSHRLNWGDLFFLVLGLMGSLGLRCLAIINL